MEAGEGDELLVRLDNAGGVLAEHGLAASQLARVRGSKVRLTVAVDKVAASGGYLMACVADHIIAAPFAMAVPYNRHQPTHFSPLTNCPDVQRTPPMPLLDR